MLTQSTVSRSVRGETTRRGGRRGERGGKERGDTTRVEEKGVKGEKGRWLLGWDRW